MKWGALSAAGGAWSSCNTIAECSINGTQPAAPTGIVNKGNIQTLKIIDAVGIMAHSFL